MSMMHFDPERELLSKNTVWSYMEERVEGASISNAYRATAHTRNAVVDVTNTPKDVEIRISLPGVKTEDLEIKLLGKEILIKGHIKDAEHI